MTVLKEIQLNKLKFLPFNRGLNHKQVTKLSNSIENYGILRAPVIVKTKAITGNVEFYVVDGQHLVTSLHKSGNKSVQCFLFESDNLSEIVNIMSVLNNVVHKWKLEDYVNAYSSLGKESYKILKSLMYKTGFAVSLCGQILGDREKIRLGTFTAYRKDADVVTKYIVDVSNTLNSSKLQYLRGYLIFVRSEKNYNHKKLMTNLLLLSNEYITETSSELAADLFRKIYNGEKI